MMAALLNELEMQAAAGYLGTSNVQTIYLGGGTPSLLATTDVAALLNRIRGLWTVEQGAEITLEANPDDVTPALLEGWKGAGVTRLSLGIQSLYEDELQWMNRAHTAEEAQMVVHLVREAGFSDFSVDLIYGGPLLTDERWLHTLNWALQQEVTHLSCYALTVESKTPLEKQIRTGRRSPTNPEQQARQFLQLMDVLEQAGWEHYEISNFARPGHRSRHNSSYWQGIPYLGIGPSAHSFNGTARQWNVAHNRNYIASIRQGRVPFEQDQLTRRDQLNEYIMTSLRRMEGCDLEKVKRTFGDAMADALEYRSRPFRQQGWVLQEAQQLRLSREGKLYADRIAADLFVLDDPAGGAFAFPQAQVQDLLKGKGEND